MTTAFTEAFCCEGHFRKRIGYLDALVAFLTFRLIKQTKKNQNLRQHTRLKNWCLLPATKSRNFFSKTE